MNTFYEGLQDKLPKIRQFRKGFNISKDNYSYGLTNKIDGESIGLHIHYYIYSKQLCYYEYNFDTTDYGYYSLLFKSDKVYQYDYNL